MRIAGTIYRERIRRRTGPHPERFPGRRRTRIPAMACWSSKSIGCPGWTCRGLSDRSKVELKARQVRVVARLRSTDELGDGDRQG